MNPKTSISTSLFARALATENIFVSFDAVAKTASFDVESRTLTIPDWKVSVALRDMIVAHEVAHALFTPAEKFLQSMADARSRKLNPQGYKACINVIEDARIERLIKEKFPGCRRDFYVGYKEILDTDLFQLNSISDNDLTIVDKINLHFKFGIFGLKNVPLNAAEQSIIDRVGNAKTYDDVVEIANDLYDLAAEEEKQNQKQNGSGMFGIMGDLSDAMQKIQRDGDPMQSKKNGYGPSNREHFTNISCPLPKAHSEHAIVSFDVIFKEMDLLRSKITDIHVLNELATLAETVKAGVGAYRNDAKASVKELVAQFERRKAAEEIRNERMKPTGNINPDRLHQFKTHDDIFLRNLVKHEGKKHGMVFLIDWSGSMTNCIDGVVRQTLLLTWFCRKAKIPYEVFLFTNGCSLLSDPSFSSEDHYKKIYSIPKRSVTADAFDLADVSLRQVFSSTMTDAEHQCMEEAMWLMANRYGGNPDSLYLTYSADYAIPACLQMNGTPTNEALMMMHDYIPKFREATGSQIVDFILMTDGEPCGLSRTGNNAYEPVKSVRVQHLPTGRTLQVNADTYGCFRSLQLDVQYFLVDEIRKLGVTTVGFSIGNLNCLGDHFVRMFIEQSSHARPSQFSSMDDYRNYTKAIEANSKKYNDFYKKENFIPAAPDLTPGFDEYYIVRPVKPTLTEQIEAEEEQDDDPTNPKKKKGPPTLTRIRNQFIKTMVGRKVSKVFLSRFIDIVAGRKVKQFKIMG